ncbi:MAG: alpha/beta hydrolase [Polaromonas sp.]|nr:MAG: alpha/beta hydrolase [Polaromonas sp.]
MYKEKRSSRSEFVPIRGLRYHVRVWDAPASPTPAQPALVLVHGWMDVAASYQFMVDALSDAFAAGRTIIAPDWRGFGQTTSAEGGASDCYWFADYLADLDFLLDHYAGQTPVDLVGHSMGGNVAMMYAGVRPGRIRRLVNLEGFGLPAARPAQAPGRYVKWMDELKSLHRGELALKAYDDAAGVAQRLMKTNPRLCLDKASWLASRWARPDAAGRWRILGEAGHKVTSANIYRAEETLEIYKRISAPVLAVEALSDSMHQWYAGKYTLADYHERLKHVPKATVAVIEDAGHMLHHDQPGALASLIEGFLAA